MAPLKFTDDELRAAMKAEGNNISAVARYFGVSNATVRRRWLHCDAPRNRPPAPKPKRKLKTPGAVVAAETLPDQVLLDLLAEAGGCTHRATSQHQFPPGEYERRKANSPGFLGRVARLRAKLNAVGRLRLCPKCVEGMPVGTREAALTKPCQQPEPENLYFARVRSRLEGAEEREVAQIARWAIAELAELLFTLAMAARDARPEPEEDDEGD